MTGPRRHRHAGAAVGALVVGLLLVALFTLGGRGDGDPAGRPESLHRGAVPTAGPDLDRSALDRQDGGLHLPDLSSSLPSPTALFLVALSLVGLLTAPPARSLVRRPVPVRSVRGPPAPGR